MNKKVLIALATVVMVAGASSTALAKKPEVDQVNTDHKVTICHRTNSVTNPYIRESVDADAADGNTGNDKGKKDHSTHTGPVATSEVVAQALKDSKTKWGDIIPQHDNYAGLNWTTEGQAIYNNNCEYVTPPVVPPTPPTPPTTTTTNPAGTVLGAQVTATPAQGVSAGAGGAASFSLPSAAALVGSTASFGYGLFRLRKFNV